MEAVQTDQVYRYVEFSGELRFDGRNKIPKDLSLLYELLDAKCFFTALLPYVSGGDLDRVRISTRSELDAYLKDPVAFAAKVCGVTRDEYETWLHSEGFVQCSGRTTSGRQCRNAVVGYKPYHFDEWLSVFRSGGYCAVHGEDQRGRQ
ncbi:MAG: hypothetical protein KF688_02815 [Pirellulales bacterium]|nr:hypothetical protein [Pirellulales bacterium]